MGYKSLNNLIKMANSPAIQNGFIQRKLAIYYAARSGYDISMLSSLPGVKKTDLIKPYYQYVIYKSVFWELYSKYIIAEMKIEYYFTLAKRWQERPYGSVCKNLSCAQKT